MSAKPVSQSLWSRALGAVLAAQFLSAMADNALLFGTLALLRHEQYALRLLCRSRDYSQDRLEAALKIDEATGRRDPAAPGATAEKLRQIEIVHAAAVPRT